MCRSLAQRFAKGEHENDQFKQDLDDFILNENAQLAAGKDIRQGKHRRSIEPLLKARRLEELLVATNNAETYQNMMETRNAFLTQLERQVPEAHEPTSASTDEIKAFRTVISELRSALWLDPPGMAHVRTTAPPGEDAYVRVANRCAQGF